MEEISCILLPSGAFGCVYKGWLTQKQEEDEAAMIQVAVKTIKSKKILTLDDFFHLTLPVLLFLSISPLSLLPCLSLLLTPSLLS